MSQRQIFRSACRALQSGLQSSARSANNSTGSTSGLLMRSFAEKLHNGSAGATAQCSGLLRSLRPAGIQVSAVPTFAPMGFAASAPSVTSSLSVLGSLAQHRGVSSTELAEDGDADEGVSEAPYGCLSLTRRYGHAKVASRPNRTGRNLLTVCGRSAERPKNSPVL
ncbi:hypothetical protein PLESTB_000153100 [Pleodorina starrii]|uniref:Uncharacterized protein n=1 Tax=Pleodorina starrii TaxID=330485 RepID=A0A9W6BB61_9CHLO|nr:hypothetical protein PLESTM_000451900 [Pleodorina starrii]GLC48829.1 hypothetical protein PLESTB_000153100 [Pleodorina starrii]GLC72568.1 hypothetical protein PLESTF_001265600 [Pleodorina starrii]